MPRIHGVYVVSFIIEAELYPGSLTRVVALSRTGMEFRIENGLYEYQFSPSEVKRVNKPLPINKPIRFVIYVMRFGDLYYYGSQRDGIIESSGVLSENQVSINSQVSLSIGGPTKKASIRKLKIFGEKL